MATSTNRPWLKLCLVSRSIFHFLPFTQNQVIVELKFEVFYTKLPFLSTIKEKQNNLAVILVTHHVQILVVQLISLHLVTSLFFLY